MNEPFPRDFLFRQKNSFQTGRPVLVYIGVLVALLVLMVAAFGFAAIRSGQNKEYVGLVAQQRVLALQMVALSSEALRAKTQAYLSLKERRDKFEGIMKVLREGDPIKGIPSSPEPVRAELGAVSTQWNDFRDNIDAILRAEPALRLLMELQRSLSASAPQLRSLSGEGEIAGAGALQGALNGRQRMLAQRVAGHINRILQYGVEPTGIGEDFSRDLREFETTFGNQNRETQESDQANENLQDTRARFSEIRTRIERIREKLPDVIKAQRAGNSVLVNADPLVDEISQLADVYDNLEKKTHFYAWIGYGSGLLALLTLILLGNRLVNDARSRELESVNRHQSERDAVSRLNNEIRTLGEGDLTVRATIDRLGNTAEIAESVNHMVSALRELVAAINETSDEVAGAAAETRAMATHSMRGSEKQVEQITSVTGTVQKFALAMEAVATDAQASLQVARQSVELADHGAQAVRHVIHAMSTTREHIQETARRVKRLGESSQEIGNIIELINDIADQTHILALNAAIQTHNGGHNASLGTVADEVQQLAERTGYATRQIESLVKAIQLDTQDAVSSIANSTHDVNEGTELAEGAGTALIAIQDVSADLAQHIRSIAQTAHQVAREAIEAAKAMDTIRAVTHEQLAGTQQTAELTENLAGLAHALRQMVKGFKLPPG